jgi:hypothetical protein
MSGPVRLRAAALAALFCALPLWPPAARAEEQAHLFNHETHFGGAELKCHECHPQPAGEAVPGLDKEICKKCHTPEPPWLGPPKPAKLVLPGRFPHGTHARKGVDCVECHEQILTPEAAGQPVLQTRQCFACHEARGLGGVLANCKGCHGLDKRSERPADHAAGWSARHGAESKLRVFGEHGRDCLLCHGSDSCRACHRAQAPRSHTGLWRLRTHGTAASWDRDSCKACHEVGGCVACHRETRPLNHTASWRSVHGLAAQSAGNETCAACHAAGFCAACHNQR